MTWFVHFDLNKFYASIIRASMPWLESSPIIVMSNNDGCSICQTKEAQAYGVKMGTAVFEIEDIIEKYGIETFSTNFPLIADISRRVKGILGRYFSSLEDYSIDEVFGEEVDIPIEVVKEKCRVVKDTILRGLHLPISCGIARTKTLAKVATRFAKNYKGYCGVCAIETEKQREKALQLTKIEDVWGIGRANTQKLNEKGIQTAYDYVTSGRISPRWVRNRLTIVGYKTYLELKGESCLELELVIQKKKNIMVSRSFGKNVTDIEVISAALSNFIFMNAAKLRAQGSKAKKIYVFLESNRHRPELGEDYSCIEIKLPVATSSNIEMAEWGRMALKALYKPGIHYKKTGFMSMDICDANAIQGNLFDTRNRTKEDLLMKAWDAIHKRFGRDALKTAKQDYGKEFWKIRQEKLTDCWSTRPKEFIQTVDYPLPSQQKTPAPLHAVATGSWSFALSS